MRLQDTRDEFGNRLMQDEGPSFIGPSQPDSASDRGTSDCPEILEAVHLVIMILSLV